VYPWAVSAGATKQQSAKRKEACDDQQVSAHMQEMREGK
jgi:hypothetical protein